MANEQRETIEVCKKKIIEPFYDFPNPTSIELKDTDVRAIETVLNMLKEKDAEIEEKDKQIDLMADFISKQDIEENICMQNKTNPDLCNVDYTNCKDCIKQYFENKVNSSEQN